MGFLGKHGKQGSSKNFTPYEGSMPNEKVLMSSLQTNAEANSDGENPANVVDGLFATARALEKIAVALSGIDSSLTTPRVGEALEGLASLKNRK
jgi:hypothetical protein